MDKMSTADSESTASDHGSSPALRAQGKTIPQLAEEKFVALKRVEYLGACNIAGLSYDEQKASAVAYAEAQAEAFRAMAALDAAIRDPSRNVHDQPRGLSAAETPNSVDGVDTDYDPSKDM